MHCFLWAVFLAQYIPCHVLEKLIVVQPLKIFPTFIEPKDLLLCLQEVAMEPYPEPSKMFSYFKHEVGRQWCTAIYHDPSCLL
jgi:hypothetical protein